MLHDIQVTPAQAAKITQGHPILDKWLAFIGPSNNYYALYPDNVASPIYEALVTVETWTTEYVETMQVRENATPLRELRAMPGFKDSGNNLKVFVGPQLYLLKTYQDDPSFGVQDAIFGTIFTLATMGIGSLAAAGAAGTAAGGATAGAAEGGAVIATTGAFDLYGSLGTGLVSTGVDAATYTAATGGVASGVIVGTESVALTVEEAAALDAMDLQNLQALEAGDIAVSANVPVTPTTPTSLETKAIDQLWKTGSSLVMKEVGKIFSGDAQSSQNSQAPRPAPVAQSPRLADSEKLWLTALAAIAAFKFL